MEALRASDICRWFRQGSVLGRSDRIHPCLYIFTCFPEHTGKVRIIVAMEHGWDMLGLQFACSTAYRSYAPPVVAHPGAALLSRTQHRRH